MAAPLLFRLSHDVREPKDVVPEAPVEPGYAFALLGYDNHAPRIERAKQLLEVATSLAMLLDCGRRLGPGLFDLPREFRGRRCGLGVAVDGLGAAHVTGLRFSSSFPVANALQVWPGGNMSNAFVSKLTPTGDALDYSMYLGGDNQLDEGHGIAVDSGGAPTLPA